MKKIIVAALVGIALMTATGCSTVSERAAKYAGLAVSEYCSTPATARLALRETVNAAVAPNGITVTCAADTATTESAE